MINGRVFDWESIKVDAPFGLDLEITNIAYSSEATAEPVFGRGNTPRGYGMGNLNQTGSIDIPHNSFLQLNAYAAVHGGVLRIRPFDITVRYANSDQVPQVDVLRKVKIEKIETDAKQGDAEVGLKKLSIKILDPILYNGVPAM